MADVDPMDWDDLRYFLCAARAKTLAGAARAMGVEHTTVGRRLSRLERGLGAPLVLRGPRGLELSGLAEALLPLVEDVERAVFAVRERATSQTARVRLAVPSGFTQLFASRLAELREECPRISLEFVSGSAIVDLMQGAADLAIRSGPVKDQDLVVRKLCDSGWSLYASPAYIARRPPIDLNDLHGHDVIGHDVSLASLPAAKWLEARASGCRVVLRSREMADMVAAAASGAGLAALPCMLADAHPGLRRLTADVIATRRLSLVYRREARISANVGAAARFVIRVIREHADRIGGLPPTSHAT